MHYFPTRAGFLTEAVLQVAFKLGEEVSEQHGLRARSERRRLEELLDRVREIHTGPLFLTTMELWVAPRTDP